MLGAQLVLPPQNVTRVIFRNHVNQLVTQSLTHSGGLALLFVISGN